MTNGNWKSAVLFGRPSEVSPVSVYGVNEKGPTLGGRFAWWGTLKGRAAT